MAEAGREDPNAIGARLVYPTAVHGHADERLAVSCTANDDYIIRRTCVYLSPSSTAADKRPDRCPECRDRYGSNTLLLLTAGCFTMTHDDRSPGAAADQGDGGDGAARGGPACSGGERRRHRGSQGKLLATHQSDALVLADNRNGPFSEHTTHGICTQDYIQEVDEAVKLALKTIKDEYVEIDKVGADGRLLLPCMTRTQGLKLLVTPPRK